MATPSSTTPPENTIQAIGRTLRWTGTLGAPTAIIAATVAVALTRPTTQARTLLIVGEHAILLLAALVAVVGWVEYLTRTFRAAMAATAQAVEQNRHQISLILDRLDAIHDQTLPEAIRQAGWLGWADASRAYETDQATGTNGTTKRRTQPPHLGLVHPED